jgi:putative tricarboxylic transport membrane protein
MKKYVRADGLIWLILGMGMCIGSIKLKLGDFRTPGPGFMPFLSGASLGISGLILIFSTTFARLGEGEEAKNEKTSVIWNWKKLINPFLTLLILFIYLLLLEPLGFVITTFICLLFLFKLSEPKKWLTPLILSVSTSVLSYLLFSVWLQCQFPRGLIKFW